jgi:hypothetical protein
MVQAIYSFQVELVPRDETIRIVQLTDTHLKAYTGGTLCWDSIRIIRCRRSSIW